MSNSENQSESDDAAALTDSPKEAKKSHAVRIIAVILGTCLFVAAAYVPYWLTRRVPYYSLTPGPTESINGLIQVPTAKKIAHKGQMFFTTVNESSGRLLRAQYLLTKWFDKEAELEPSRDVEGIPQVFCASPNQFASETMSVSQKTALSVALRRVALPVKTTANAFVQVQRVVPGSAAAGKLRVCDTMVSIDGQKISTAQQPREIVRAKKPGDVVTIVVRDQTNTLHTVEATLGQDKNGTPLLGIVPGYNPYPELHVTTPLGIKFRRTQIGGPSAGLAFTLGLIDDLTPGELTGGKPVAATGEVALDGTVQPIGGISEKTHSVYNHGIRLFLVPAENYKEAKKAAPKGLVIVSVRNVNDALAALQAHGGNVKSLPKSADLSKL